MTTQSAEPATLSEVEREARELAARAVSTTVERVETVGSMDHESRGALYHLLSSLADNKYVLGRRYAEWCTGAPMLESAVAAAAMAQDELGHARSFYPLLRGFPEATDADTMEDRGWQNRPASPMACLDLRFASWVDFVAANLIVDAALTTLLEAATESPYEPLRQRARKITQEEEAHWVHAHGWAQRFAADPEKRADFERALAAVWDDAFTWFGLPDDPVLARLVTSGLLAVGPGDLRDQLRARLSGVLAPAGLESALTSRHLPWDRYDAPARRLRPS